MPGYFLTGEHVNITQWESSHSPHAAFLFMSLNSINGLLGHRTVVVPSCGVFLGEVLVAAAEKCCTLKECSLFGCSAGCETLVRGLAVGSDVTLTLSVQWRSNAVLASVFFLDFRRIAVGNSPKWIPSIPKCYLSAAQQNTEVQPNGSEQQILWLKTLTLSHILCMYLFIYSLQLHWYLTDYYCTEPDWLPFGILKLPHTCFLTIKCNFTVKILWSCTVACPAQCICPALLWCTIVYFLMSCVLLRSLPEY